MEIDELLGVVSIELLSTGDVKREIKYNSL